MSILQRPPLLLRCGSGRPVPPWLWCSSWALHLFVVSCSVLWIPLPGFGQDELSGLCWFSSRAPVETFLRVSGDFNENGGVVLFLFLYPWLSVWLLVFHWDAFCCVWRDLGFGEDHMHVCTNLSTKTNFSWHSVFFSIRKSGLEPSSFVFNVFSFLCFS